MKQLMEKLKLKGKALKKEVGALYLAYKRKDTPIYAKIVALLVVAYALSPIDLIPDFIPVLGYLDDIILLPLGISLAVKLIPKEIMEECREQSEEMIKEGTKESKIAAAVILGMWILIIGYIIWKILK